ncbi:MAG: hypothetical protein FJ279_25100 [Planctomycetes bacterium]|nr:hypothetical protein [Planctomycetota bacterium]MBM4081295.1 hypothetical protein [Planctomycetota bacterium]MBM4087657.1 hypothetical protein [Planctomycetota bacterium]
MSSATVATVTRMIESLPEPVQERVMEHIREYIEDLRDELRWDAAFKRTRPQLVAAARRAKKQIAEGQAEPLDYDRL